MELKEKKNIKNTGYDNSKLDIESWIFKPIYSKPTLKWPTFHWKLTIFNISFERNTDTQAVKREGVIEYSLFSS